MARQLAWPFLFTPQTGVMTKKRTEKRTRSRKLALRDPEIKSSAHTHFQYLLELHDETDPNQGKKAEDGKMERARLAVHHWWRLYGHLMIWAQAHLTGYYVAHSSPKWVDRLVALRGAELNEDSHELELLGLMYIFNPPPDALAHTEWLGERLENVEGGLDDADLRRIIDELHLSTDANSSYWRFPLGRALRAIPFSSRRKRRREGRLTLLPITGLSPSLMYGIGAAKE